MERQITLSCAAGLMAAIGLLPILVMLGRSVIMDGGLSFQNYQDVLATRHQWTLIGQSMALAVLTTGLSTAVGLFLGILLAKTDVPLRRLFAMLFTLPLLLPPYIVAVSWFHILGKEGMLARFIGSSIGDLTSSWFFGLPGCVLVLTSTFVPIVMLLVMIFVRMIDPELEEAGKLDMEWPGILTRITMPLIAPGLMLAMLLVFLLTLGEFGVPLYLRYAVFSVESFIRFSAFYDYGTATALAFPLAVITMLVLLLESRFLRAHTYRLQPSYADIKNTRIRLGKYRLWFFTEICILGVVMVLLPLAALIIQSASPSAYLEALTRAGDSLARSFAYAGVGASVMTILGLFLGYLIHTRAARYWRSADSLTLFLFAMPSPVIGIGLISLWNTPFTNFIYATPAMIILGYLAQYTALTSRITVSTLSHLSPAMEEAADVEGASWFQRIRFIVVPMAKPGLIGGWLVACIFCLRDTGITMMVYPPGRETLPVRIFTLMANGSAELIAALCVIMMSAVVVPFGILGWLFRFKHSENP